MALIEDLRAAIQHCCSVEEIAEFLCRADRVEDVAYKREELSLRAKGGKECQRALATSHTPRSALHYKN
jgi:hypothetical protein